MVHVVPLKADTIPEISRATGIPVETLGRFLAASEDPQYFNIDEINKFE